MHQGFETETLLNAEGWEALDLSRYDQADEQARQQLLLIAGHFQSTFTQTEQGKFVLRTLVENYLLPRIVEPTGNKFDAGIRQGQADVVRQILAFIDIARTGGAPT